MAISTRRDLQEMDFEELKRQHDEKKRRLIEKRISLGQDTGYAAKSEPVDSAMSEEPKEKSEPTRAPKTEVRRETRPKAEPKLNLEPEEASLTRSERRKRAGAQTDAVSPFQL